LLGNNFFYEISNLSGPCPPLIALESWHYYTNLLGGGCFGYSEADKATATVKRTVLMQTYRGGQSIRKKKKNPLTSLLSPSLRRCAARWIYAPSPSSSLYPIAPVLDPPLGTPLLTIHRQRTPQPSSHHRKTGPSWVCRQGARPPWIRRGCGPPRTPPASSR